MITQPERYLGKVTTIGNSKGIRLDASFFKRHPEFIGKVNATVLTEGQVLLSAKTLKKSKNNEDEDPVLLAFLQFLEKELMEHPEYIVPADDGQLARIKKLVKGIKTD